MSVSTEALQKNLNSIRNTTTSKDLELQNTNCHVLTAITEHLPPSRPKTISGQIWAILVALDAPNGGLQHLFGAQKATEGCLLIHAYFSDRPSYLIGFPTTRHQRDGVQGVASESKHALIQKPPEHRSPRQHNEPIHQVHDSSQWIDSKMKTEEKKRESSAQQQWKITYIALEKRNIIYVQRPWIFLHEQIVLNFAHYSCSRNLLPCLLRVWRSSVFFASKCFKSVRV